MGTMNMNKYQKQLYTTTLQQIQTGTTFNTLVTRVLQHLRTTQNNLQGQVDRMDIRAAITRLAIHGAININNRTITHNLPTTMSIGEYLEKL